MKTHVIHVVNNLGSSDDFRTIDNAKLAPRTCIQRVSENSVLERHPEVATPDFMAVTDVLSFRPTKREVLSGIAPHLFQERPRRKPSRRHERRVKRSPLAVSTSVDGQASSVILVSEASPQEFKGIINHLQEGAAMKRGSEHDSSTEVVRVPNSGKVFTRMKTVLFGFKVVKNEKQKTKSAPRRR